MLAEHSRVSMLYPISGVLSRIIKRLLIMVEA